MGLRKNYIRLRTHISKDGWEFPFVVGYGKGSEQIQQLFLSSKTKNGLYYC